MRVSKASDGPCHCGSILSEPGVKSRSKSQDRRKAHRDENGALEVEGVTALLVFDWARRRCPKRNSILYTSATDLTAKQRHSNDCECRSAGHADDDCKLEKGCDAGQHRRSRSWIQYFRILLRSYAHRIRGSGAGGKTSDESLKRRPWRDPPMPIAIRPADEVTRLMHPAAPERRK
jgi:hypothetical protein